MKQWDQLGNMQNWISKTFLNKNHPTLAPSSCQTCNVTKCELVKDGSKREIIHCSMILKPLNGGESKEDAQRTLVGFLWRWPVDAHYYSMVPLIWLKGHLITATN